MNTMALISTLLFGFSAGLLLNFDASLFEADEADKVWGYLFIIAAMTTLLSSSLSTVVAISIIISFRRLMFKFGKQTDAQSLHTFKHRTHLIRHWVWLFIYISFIGTVATVVLYSVVKWEDDNLKVLTAVLAICGMILLIASHCFIKMRYAAVMREKKSKGLWDSAHARNSVIEINSIN